MNTEMKELLYDKTLAPREMRLLMILMDKPEVTKNEDLADMLDCTVPNIVVMTNSLKKKGKIKVTFVKEKQPRLGRIIEIL